MHLVTEQLMSEKVNTRNGEIHMYGSHHKGRYDLHLLDDLRLPRVQFARKCYGKALALRTLIL